MSKPIDSFSWLLALMFTQYHLHLLKVGSQRPLRNASNSILSRTYYAVHATGLHFSETIHLHEIYISPLINTIQK